VYGTENLAEVKQIRSYDLAFTRYCHYQSCIVPETQEWGRGGTIHCAIFFVGKTPGGDIKEAFRINIGID